ncbi:hypothetical protein JVU11DRAFT_12479 [Chiua virens]|nr:hypothetical protein JVU11DRAFT_12479 [Chiua virens]
MPNTHPHLLTIQDLHREEDLLRNPWSFRVRWTAMQNTRDAFNALLKEERRENSSLDESAQLLGPLSTPLARCSLQCPAYTYEAVLVQFPGSFSYGNDICR